MTDTDRDTRREQLLVLISRVERGVITEAERPRLRPLIEAELAAGDSARRSAGGRDAENRRLSVELAELKAARSTPEQQGAVLSAQLAATFPEEPGPFSHAERLRTGRAGGLALDEPADIEISDPHAIGEAHGCPEECPAHNPGGPDVDPDTVAGAATDCIEVAQYSEAGRTAWVMRCWGTDTCDGWASLDHYSETSANAARDRHIAEHH